MASNSVLIQDNFKKNKDIKINKSKIKELILLILKDHNIESSEVSLLFTNDQQIQELNSLYRDKNKPTDVLSFPTTVKGAGALPVVDGELEMLGDVVVSVETTLRQALDYKVSFEEELNRLIVHGVLHLLGYDHVNGGRQAGKMKAKEELFLKKI